eukprot:g3686.t1
MVRADGPGQGGRALFDAVDSGELAFGEVDALIVAGANVDWINGDGLTSLMMACRKGNQRAASRLIQAGADQAVRGAAGAPLKPIDKALWAWLDENGWAKYAKAFSEAITYQDLLKKGFVDNKMLKHVVGIADDATRGRILDAIDSLSDADQGATEGVAESKRGHHESQPVRPAAELVESNLKVLIIGCDLPGNSPAKKLSMLEKEGRTVQQIYQQRYGRAAVKVYPKDCKVADFTRLLAHNAFDVVHLMGHMDAKDPNDKFTLLFVDEKGKPEILLQTDLVKLLSAATIRKCLVLMGCRSNHIAQKLHDKGIRCIVSWKTRVQDGPCHLFSEGFHLALAGNSPKTPEDAFEFAKLFVTTEADPNSGCVHVGGGVYAQPNKSKYILADPDDGKDGAIGIGKPDLYVQPEAKMGMALEDEERLHWFRFTRLLLDVIYPLLRRVFKDRFKKKYGIAWDDQPATSKILGGQTVGDNPCGLLVHGGVVGGFDAALPGDFELKNGGNEIRTSEDLTAILEDGMFLQLGPPDPGPTYAFTVRKTTKKTESVYPPQDHGEGRRSEGKIMITRKHDGPDFKGKVAHYATICVPPLAKRNGTAVDTHILRWIEAGDANKFEMTALNNILLGTAGCVMDPASAADPLFKNDIVNAEFWARANGTSVSGIAITGERIVQRLVLMRNQMMAHAAKTRMPLADFNRVKRLSTFAVSYFSSAGGGGHKADDLATELKTALGENPGKDEFHRRTEAFMSE